MTIRNAGEILTAEIGKAVTVLHGCVTPLFNANDKGEAELLGSAVLLQIDGGIFLCTAKHVIDANKDSSFYVDGPARLEILTGDFYTSAEYDAAVLKLTKEQVALLSKYEPLLPADLAGQAETLAAKYASMVGFPEKKNRKRYRKNEIAGLIYSVSGTIIEATTERVRVKFNRHKNIDAKTRLRVKAPDPHGMSGGAIFTVGMTKATIEGKPAPKLAGILTDCPDQSKELFGPSVVILLAMIRDSYGVVLPARLEAPNVRTRVE